MTTRTFSPYDEVAAEYYDPAKHPTCANFRSLTERFFLDYFSPHGLNIDLEQPIIETGCGKSVIAQIADSDVLPFPKQLTLQDDSEKMLEHSKRWQNRTSDMIVCDARKLPYPSNYFSGFFSFLADPYNDEGLWDEVSRVLAYGGVWMTSLPSHRWAKAFRVPSEVKASRFVVEGNREIDLPSFTYDPHFIVAEMSVRGLDLIRFHSYNSTDIEEPISEKLLSESQILSVLDCYIFRKSLHGLQAT